VPTQGRTYIRGDTFEEKLSFQYKVSAKLPAAVHPTGDCRALDQINLYNKSERRVEHGSLFSAGYLGVLGVLQRSLTQVEWCKVQCKMPSQFQDGEDDIAGLCTRFICHCTAHFEFALVVTEGKINVLSTFVRLQRRSGSSGGSESK